MRRRRGRGRRWRMWTMRMSKEEVGEKKEEKGRARQRSLRG